MSWKGFGVLVAVAAGFFGYRASQTDGSDELVLYSGRSRIMVQPLLERFTRQTGIEVKVRYGHTTQLAMALREEGDRSPADVFWAQDAGALAALAKRGVFRKLAPPLLERVPPWYRNAEGYWVATSGRSRVLAYSPRRVAEDAVPTSVLDLRDPIYRDRVGWAPANPSFQAFVTAARRSLGDDTVRRWLVDMKANGARPYAKNSAILEAIAAGEVDFGLPNHYYLFRKKKQDKNYPVEQRAFAAGDIGNLVNVAGVGILSTSHHRDAARAFVKYLVSSEAQLYFSSETFEYPVADGVPPNPELTGLSELRERAPSVDLDSLDDLNGTLDLLKEVGLL